jgi:uncharacterized protein (DUF1015 family)
MATIKPFKAVRPPKEIVGLVASPSLDRFTPEEFQKEILSNEYSFLQVIKPEEKNGSIKNNSPEHYKKCKQRYLDFKKSNILQKDEKEAFYVYQQSSENYVSTGIIGLASIDDYFDKVIKIHEQTLLNKERALKNYLRLCDIHAEPVVLTYQPHLKISKIVAETVQKETEYEFLSSDGIKHKLWLINDANDIIEIINSFKQISALYIADGHHRSASSALLGNELREEKTNYSGNETFNYFLCIFFPFNQLKIYDYSKLIKDINGMSTEIFLTKLGDCFNVKLKGKKAYIPNMQRHIGMYIDGNWYELIPKPNLDIDSDPVHSLDASLLYDYIITTTLRVEDFRRDKRIAFTGGANNIKEIEKRVNSGEMKVGFCLYPITIEQLTRISAMNKTMPPKSTWIEPKLRSGMLIYELEIS